MYRIGEFSKITKTTIKTLRYYDETGLLKPSYVDQENGYRYYTTDQMLPLHHIVSLRQAGLSVDETAAVLSGKNIGQILTTRSAELTAEIHAAQRQLSRINYLLSSNKEDFFMNYQATVRDLPACTVYYKQGVIRTFDEMESFILQSGDECRAANPNIKCAQPDYCFVSYLDPEFKKENIAIEYVQAVTKAGAETDTIKFRKLESVPAVCVLHRGPYESIGEAFAFTYNWMEQNGYTAAERPRENYIDGVWNKENPEEWLTEIQVPIVKK